MEDAIHFNSPEFSELMQKATDTEKLLDSIGRHTRPMLGSERYLTTEQVCWMLHICKRALQDYRDKRLIPFTALGGKILYPQSKIEELLKRNYTPAQREIEE